MKALVAGAGRAAKKFTDIGAAVADGFKTLEPEPTAANLGNYNYPGEFLTAITAKAKALRGNNRRNNRRNNKNR